MRTSLPSAIVAVILTVPLAPASAHDHIVDAAGLASPHTNIAAAMAVAAPGDRILVMPGDYPAFQFSRGVHIHGLGDGPTDVRIARVDYHVSIPSIGYDTSLTNVEIGSAQTLGEIPISGNELPPGVFVLDGVIVNGGVFLGGGDDGFAAMITNSVVRAGSGEGFAGVAVHVGGENCRVDIVDTAIWAWNDDVTTGHGAGAGLRLVGGTHATITDSLIVGGDATSMPGNGGSAIVDGGPAHPVHLRLDGNTAVIGGDASNGVGGHAVDIAGTVSLGAAAIVPGTGVQDGVGWANAGPTALPVSLHLETTPAFFAAERGVAIESGDSWGLHLPAGPMSAIALSFDLDVPVPHTATPFASPFVLFSIGSSLTVDIPASPAGHDIPGVMVFAQGWVRDPASHVLFESNPVAARIDLLPVLP